MGKILATLTGMVLLLWTPGVLKNAFALPPTKGGVLPTIDLPIPRDSDDKSYLGLSGDGSFKIPQIKARIVIVEIFGLYCPQCIKIAPSVKELYQKIEDDPGLRGTVKLIGIGAGNTLSEVHFYKVMTAAPFPLFSDQDFTLHATLGEVRTPYFIAIRINGDRTHVVIYSEPGGVEDAESFLELILLNLGPK
jgi:thiol-disulfide isomerase/thioredoxin